MTERKKEDGFTLTRSKIQFYSDGEAEIRYSPHNFLDDLIDLFDYRENKDNLRTDLIENARLSRNQDWMADGNRHIQKADFITAITKSLEHDPTDGLSSIVESETVCEEEGNSTSENDNYELKRCFQDNFLQKHVAEELADSITGNAWDKADFNSSAVRHSFIKDISEGYSSGSWKEFIEEKMQKCDKEHHLELSPFFKANHNDAYDFLNCLVEEIKEEKENLLEPYFDHCRDAFYTTWNINDEKHLKELSEEKDIPFDLLQHCTSFESGILEKYRPIKENQTFLESYGAKIWEHSEDNED